MTEGAGPDARQMPAAGWMFGRTRRVHFVGVGGIGMSGIAELLVNLGYDVSGSDEKSSDITDRLQAMGVEVFVGHDARQVGDADVVVMSAAIRADNPEVVEAAARRVPVIPRAEMLAELMRLRYGIAIAGTHGKTTTTSMVALVLERAGLDPTAIIGGRLSAFGSSARLGRGAPIVVEADESDRSFLRLSPVLALVTNIDREHLEAYGSWDALEGAFLEFVNRVPFYGVSVLCADDAAVRALMPRVRRRVITYGLEREDVPPPDVAGHGLVLEPFGASCRVTQRAGPLRQELGRLQLAVPGRHNLLNALGAAAIALELQVPFARIVAALAEFGGAERRFQRRGEARGVLVVDDYGHHPTEIRAVVDAARVSGRRIVLVFQPHRYSRTRDLMEAFSQALATGDEVVLTDIYAAGEPAIPGVTLEALAERTGREAPRPPHVVPRLEDVPDAVARIARSGDLVITLGAGSIGTVGDRILAAIDARPASTTGGAP